MEYTSVYCILVYTAQECRKIEQNLIDRNLGILPTQYPEIEFSISGYYLPSKCQVSGVSEEQIKKLLHKDILKNTKKATQY